MKRRSAPSHSQWAGDHGSPACQGGGCVQHPPIILCNTGSYGSCAITTTCATHTQLRHQRAELRRILPASTGDYQSRIFHHRSFFSSLQVSRDESRASVCLLTGFFSLHPIWASPVRIGFYFLRLRLCTNIVRESNPGCSLGRRAFYHRGAPSGNRTRAARLPGEQPLDHYRSFYQILKSFDPKLGSNFPPVAKFGLIHSLAQQTVTTLQ